LIGERTTVAERTSVKRSVIGKSCSIGANVKLANCVVMDRVRIENGYVARLMFKPQFGSNATSACRLNRVAAFL